MGEVVTELLKHAKIMKMFMLSVTKVCTVSIKLSEAKIGWKDDEKWKHTLAKYPSLSASVPGTLGICYSFPSSTSSFLF